MSQQREKPVVFLSHISEEAQLTDILRRQLDEDFLEQFTFFVSSDPGSIPAGERWLDRITTALKSAQVLLVLCSKQSVGRPWINFECGAGWVRGVPVVPICHTGMTPSALPSPLNQLQAVKANDDAHLKRLYHLLSDTLKTRMPPADYASLAGKVQGFEREYGFLGVVRNAVNALVKVKPKLQFMFVPLSFGRSEHPKWNEELREFMKGKVPIRKISLRVPQLDMDRIRPPLDTLQNANLIKYSTDKGSIMSFAGGPTGVFYELDLEALDAYYEIAEHVTPVTKDVNGNVQVKF